MMMWGNHVVHTTPSRTPTANIRWLLFFFQFSIFVFYFEGYIFFLTFTCSIFAAIISSYNIFFFFFYHRPMTFRAFPPTMSLQSLRGNFWNNHLEGWSVFFCLLNFFHWFEFMTYLESLGIRIFYLSTCLFCEILIM